MTTHKRTTNRPPRARDLKLPHERDESTEADTSLSHDGPGRPVIDQGASDLESGQRDTDCYTAAVPRYRKQERK